METGVVPHRKSNRGRRGGVALLLSLSAACGAGTPAPVDSPSGRSLMPTDSLYQLSLREPMVRQVLDSVLGGRPRPRFVRIDVTAVTNPARVALSLELRYRDAERETVLGSVSLFPADNPGRFIVPTLDRIGASGQLTLTLVSPDSGAGRADVRVTVRGLVFVDE